MTKLTLLDLAKRKGNDAIVGIVDATVQRNALLSLLPFRGINGVSFKFARRRSLPSVSFKGYNQGVDATKSAIDQILIETKNIGGRSEIDKLLADADPRGVNALRAEEDSGFAAAMGNLMNLKAFYGNSITSLGLEFDGFSTLLNTLSLDTVLGAGGSTADSMTSAYFVAFQDTTGVNGLMRGVEGILGNNKNISAVNMGLQYALDADSKKFLAYTTEFEFAPGLAIYDTKSIGRIANIDATNKITSRLINQMTANMFPYQAGAIFCNKEVWLQIQDLKLAAIETRSSETDFFRQVLTFNGIPVFIDDNITQTEAVLT